MGTTQKLLWCTAFAVGLLYSACVGILAHALGVAKAWSFPQFIICSIVLVLYLGMVQWLDTSTQLKRSNS